MCAGHLGTHKQALAGKSREGNGLLVSKVNKRASPQLSKPLLLASYFDLPSPFCEEGLSP